MSDNTNQQGQRFLVWLARAAIEVRTEAGARDDQVSALVPGNGAIYRIKRFESAERAPRDLERIIAAYARVAGLDDPRTIYQRALDLWWEHGSKPLLGAKDDGAGLTAGQQFEKELASRRDRPRGPAETEGSSSATRKRRASL